MQLKIIYRKSLRMSPCKIAAQAVHASVGIRHDVYDLSVVVRGVSDDKFKEAKAQNPYRFLLGAAGIETCMAYYE